jgi:pyruvate formate lyase activating enzyme
MIDRSPTPVETMERARGIARKAGLHHIYIGNMAGRDYNDTMCPGCGSLLISRTGFSVKVKGLKGDACSKCGDRLFGVFR